MNKNTYLPLILSEVGYRKQTKHTLGGLSDTFQTTGRQSDFRSNHRRVICNYPKLKKYHCGFISSQNTLKKAEKDGKQKLLFRFVPLRRVIENSKKMEKKFRKLKNTIVASFQAIIGWNRPRNRENKKYHSVSFQPDA